MFKFRIFFVFYVFLKSTLSDESTVFSSESKFFEFLENWTVSESATDVRSMQSTFTRHLMNNSVDPCKNFYEFACGNFESIADIVPTQSGSENADLFYLVYRFGDHLIERAIKEGTVWEEPGYENVRNLYLSCINDDLWKSKKKARALRDYEYSNGQFLRYFAHWPILHDGNDWEDKFDLETTVARADLLGFKTLFDHKIKEKNEIFYDSLEPCWGRVFDLDKLINISATAGIYMDDKESDLYSAILFMVDLNELTTTTDYGEEEENIYTINQLSNLYPDFDYNKYFTKLYVKGIRITSSSKIYIPDHRNFRWMNELIARTGKKVLANVIFLSMLCNLIPGPLGDFDRSSSPSDTCTNLAKSALQISLLKWFSKKYLKESTQQQANHLARTIQNVAYKYFKNEFNNEYGAKRHRPLSRIYSPKREIFHPLTDELKPLVDDLQKVQFNLNSLLDNIFVISQIQKQLRLRNADHRIFGLNVFARFLEENGLTVPVTLFLPPFYHEYAPNYMMYGAMGSYIAKQISNDVTEQGIRSSHASNPGYIYIRRGKTKTYAAKKGIELAMIAYKNWLAQDVNNTETTDIKINGRVLDGIQGLYLSSAQSMCSMEDELWKRQYFWDFPSFNEAFNCPSSEESLIENLISNYSIH